MLQLFFLVILSWLAVYWLPTVPAVIAVAVLFALFTGNTLRKAVKRGRRILAERQASGTVPAAPRGKYDGMLSLFYWRETMVHAMLLGIMAGGAFGVGGDLAGSGGADVGGEFGAGDFGGGDFGGGGL